MDNKIIEKMVKENEYKFRKIKEQEALYEDLMQNFKRMSTNFDKHLDKIKDLESWKLKAKERFEWYENKIKELEKLNSRNREC